MKKKPYDKPSAEVVTVRAQSGLLTGSGGAMLGGTLDGWEDDGKDAWDELSASEGSGSNMDGWIDSGDSAWE